jgi:hypothetical protein
LRMWTLRSFQTGMNFQHIWNWMQKISSQYLHIHFWANFISNNLLCFPVLRNLVQCFFWSHFLVL